MSHRINVILEDETWEALQIVPKGARSSVINKLVSDWALSQKRRNIMKEIDEIRKTMKPMPGSAEEWIREDRDNHY